MLNATRLPAIILVLVVVLMQIGLMVVGHYYIESEVRSAEEKVTARMEEAESRLLQISQDHASKLAALQTAQQELRAVEHFANNELQVSCCICECS